MPLQVVSRYTTYSRPKKRIKYASSKAMRSRKNKYAAAANAGCKHSTDTCTHAQANRHKHARGKEVGEVVNLLSHNAGP